MTPHLLPAERFDLLVSIVAGMGFESINYNDLAE